VSVFDRIDSCTIYAVQITRGLLMLLLAQNNGVFLLSPADSSCGVSRGALSPTLGLSLPCVDRQSGLTERLAAAIHDKRPILP